MEEMRAPNHDSGHEDHEGARRARWFNLLTAY